MNLEMMDLLYNTEKVALAVSCNMPTVSTDDLDLTNGRLGSYYSPECFELKNTIESELKNRGDENVYKRLVHYLRTSDN